MNLLRLIYSSRAVAPQTAPGLIELLAVSCRNNSRDGLTGLLCYGAPYFFQCLEGTPAAVNKTMEKIGRDARHTDIALVDARLVAEREFAEWSMKLIRPNELSPDLFRSLYEVAYTGSDLNSADQLLTILKRMVLWTLPYPS